MDVAGKKQRKPAERSPANEARKPAPWLYVPLYLLGSLLLLMVYRLKVKRGPAFRRYKGPLIVLGNHCSYSDPLIMACGLGIQWRINFLAASFIFSTPFKQAFFRALGVIPTTQFATNPGSTRQMIKLLRSGACVAFSPEAERCAFGELTPFDMTSAKFIKMMKVPVALCLLHGAYLNWPRWAPSRLYSGKVEVETELLFTTEALESLSVEEIHAILLRALESPDYDWQKSLAQPHAYRRRRSALGLHTQLFKCVRCGANFSLRSEACALVCLHCQGRWEIGADGFFCEDSRKEEPWLETPLDWQRRQCELQSVLFKQEGFHHSFAGQLYSVALKRSLQGEALLLLGEGCLEVSRVGLRFIFSQKSEQTASEYFFPYAELQGMMMEYGEYFQIYHSGQLFQCKLDEGQACALVRACWTLARPGGLPGVKKSSNTCQSSATTTLN